MSYKAIVTRIHTRELPGSDNIVIGNCLGYQVLVNKNTVSGELGIFFEYGGQLSEEFAVVHDLVRRKDDQGNNAGGYFEENRRVRAVKMRGAKSEGFWVPISYLKYTGTFDLKEGDQFDELNGHKICNKYYTPQTLRAANRNQQRVVRDNTMFRKHVETEAFKRGLAVIPQGAAIYISAKLHGTSFRYGHVLESTPIKRGKVKQFFATLCKRPTENKGWTHLNGSRNVVLSKCPETYEGFHGKEGFRFAATRGVALHKGEVIYGELCGFTETNEPIMAVQATSKLKDKQIEKQFGGQMVYRYGAADGECKAFVYRITQVNEDGHVVELSWPQVVYRCQELGLAVVPHITQFFFNGDHCSLAEIVETLTEGEDGVVLSRLDPTHIEEGVVVRYESAHGIGWLKNKCTLFGMLEGYLKEKDDYVDTEEAA